MIVSVIVSVIVFVIVTVIVTVVMVVVFVAFVVVMMMVVEVVVGTCGTVIVGRSSIFLRRKILVVEMVVGMVVSRQVVVAVPQDVGQREVDYDSYRCNPTHEASLDGVFVDRTCESLDGLAGQHQTHKGQRQHAKECGQGFGSFQSKGVSGRGR